MNRHILLLCSTCPNLPVNVGTTAWIKLFFKDNADICEDIENQEITKITKPSIT